MQICWFFVLEVLRVTAYSKQILRTLEGFRQVRQEIQDGLLFTQ